MLRSPRAARKHNRQFDGVYWSLYLPPHDSCVARVNDTLCSHFHLALGSAGRPFIYNWVLLNGGSGDLVEFFNSEARRKASIFIPRDLLQRSSALSIRLWVRNYETMPFDKFKNFQCILGICCVCGLVYASSLKAMLSYEV